MSRSTPRTCFSTALVWSLGVAAPAAHAAPQPGVYALSSGRIGAIAAVIAALIGAVIGGLAVARARDRRRRARLALILAPLGLAGGAVVVATAGGGLGTGHGFGGGVAAIAIGLIGSALGGVARARS